MSAHWPMALRRMVLALAERARPAEQLLDPVACLLIGPAFGGLEIPVGDRGDAELPRRLLSREPGPFAVLAEQIAEHRHDRTLAGGTVRAARLGSSGNL